MPGFSDYMEANILNYMRGTQMPTPPTAIYVALFNGDPTDTGTGSTEVTTTIRPAGRVAATFGAPNATDGTMSNSAEVDFGNAQGAATVTHFATFTAASGGNMLMSGALTSGAGSVALGASTKFAVGALVKTVS